MPSNPTPGQVHIDRALTNMMVAYEQEDSAFIAGKVFPQVNVQKQTDRYFVWDRSDMFRDKMEPVGPGGEAPIGIKRLSTDSYRCEVYKYAELLDDQTLANADDPLDLERMTVRSIAHAGLLKKETTWVSKFLTTGVWGLDREGVASGASSDQFVQFDAASSTPIELLRKDMYDMAEENGVMPNTLVVGPHVYRILLDHAEFIARYENVAPAIMNQDLIAAVLGVQRVLVPMAIQNTAVEGAAESNSFIHARSMLLCYAAPSAGIGTPSAGLTFNWTGLQAPGMQMKRIDRPLRDSVQYQGELAYDQKVVAPSLGKFYYNVVATTA